MDINPKWATAAGVAITIATAISTNPTILNHAVPDAWIPFITAWSGIIATLGAGILTYMHAVSGPQAGPLAK